MRKLTIVLFVLMGCAGNKPVAEQKANAADDPRCEEFLSCLEEFYPKYFKNKYDVSFETVEELMKMPFPLDLENGTILFCLETITCNKTNYCATIQDNEGHTIKF